MTLQILKNILPSKKEKKELTFSKHIEERGQINHKMRSEKIFIKPIYSIIVHDADTVELRRGVWNNESHMLCDQQKEGVLAEIILSLKAKKTSIEIAKEFNIRISTVESTIDYLQQLGVLQSSAESFLDYYIENLMSVLRAHQNKYLPHSSLIMLGDFNLSHQLITYFKQLATTNNFNISISHDVESWNTITESTDNWLFDALEQEEFCNQFSHWQGKFVVLASRYIHPSHLSKFNRIALQHNISWLNLALDGPFIFVGPTFTGVQGPCFDCFETRVSMNLRDSENYQRYKNALGRNMVHHNDEDPLFQISSTLLIAHASIEILNFITTRCSFTTRKVLSIFLPTMEFIYHDLLKLPACRSCGSITNRDHTQLYFDFQSLLPDMQTMQSAIVK